MNPKTILLATTVILLGLPIHSESDAQALSSGERDSWSPNAGLMTNLVTATISTYQIKVPKGYEPIEQPGPGTTKAFAWKGTTRTDGSAPQLMVVITAAPPGETNMPPVELVLTKFLGGVKARRQNWVQTDAERGQINGLTFLRSYWRGTDSSRGSKMKGFMYVTVDGQNIIQISSQDVEPHCDESLKLAEAGALTVQHSKQ